MKFKSYLWFLSQAPLPTLLLISALAWLLLWFGGHQHAAHQLPSATIEAQLHHHSHHSATQVAQLTTPVSDTLVELAQLSGWTIMVLAMMFPLLHNAIRHIWQRSLPRLRLLGGALFCLGYLALWILIGYLSNALLKFGQISPGWKEATAMALLVILWQASPWKQWALNYCHYTQRLALSGWPYAYDCLRFGLKKGAWCISSCWHLMLFPMLLDSFVLMFVAMLAICVWMFVEQHLAPRQPKWRLPFSIG